MEEQRTFSNALARLFGLLLAIILFVLAIWFVVRQVNSSDNDTVVVETGTVVTVDDDTNSVIERTIGEDTLITVGETDDSLGAATEEEVLAATTDSTPITTQESALPNTGAGTSIIGVFAVVFAAQIYIKARKSQNEFQTVNINS